MNDKTLALEQSDALVIYYAGGPWATQIPYYAQQVVRLTHSCCPNVKIMIIVDTFNKTYNPDKDYFDFAKDMERVFFLDNQQLPEFIEFSSKATASRQRLCDDHCDTRLIAANLDIFFRADAASEVTTQLLEQCAQSAKNLRSAQLMAIMIFPKTVVRLDMDVALISPQALLDIDDYKMCERFTLCHNSNKKVTFLCGGYDYVTHGIAFNTDNQSCASKQIDLASKLARCLRKNNIRSHNAVHYQMTALRDDLARYQFSDEKSIAEDDTRERSKIIEAIEQTIAKGTDQSQQLNKTWQYIQKHSLRPNIDVIAPQQSKIFKTLEQNQIKSTCQTNESLILQSIEQSELYNSAKMKSEDAWTDPEKAIMFAHRNLGRYLATEQERAAAEAVINKQKEMLETDHIALDYMITAADQYRAVMQANAATTQTAATSGQVKQAEATEETCADDLVLANMVKEVIERSAAEALVQSSAITKTLEDATTQSASANKFCCAII